MRKTAWLFFGIAMLLLTNCPTFQKLRIDYPDYLKAYTNSGLGRPYKILGQVSGSHTPDLWSVTPWNPTFQGEEVDYEKYGDYKKHKWVSRPNIGPNPKPDYPEATRYLLDAAYDTYGNFAAAVINVKYSTRVEIYNRNGIYDSNKQRMITTATGQVVCFTDRNNQCIDQSLQHQSQPPVKQAAPPSQTTAQVQFTKEEFRSLPTVILGQKRKSTKPNNYAQDSHGYVRGFLYEYGTFKLRLIEFDNTENAKQFWYLKSKTFGASILERYFIWHNEPGLLYGSHLCYLIDTTKAILIYPKDANIKTALKIANKLR